MSSFRSKSPRRQSKPGMRVRGNLHFCKNKHSSSGIILYFLSSFLVPTIMDKSLGTNLHLRRLFTRAKRIHLHLFSPSPPSPPPPPYNVGHVYMLFLQSFNIVLGGWRGEQRILKRITVPFLKLRFKNTEN